MRQSVRYSAAGQKAALASHKKHSRGHQTARQLAAERNNLAIARSHRSMTISRTPITPVPTTYSGIVALPAPIPAKGKKPRLLKSERLPKFRLKSRNKGAVRYNLHSNLGARPASNPYLAGKKAAKRARQFGKKSGSTTKNYQQMTNGPTLAVSANAKKYRLKTRSVRVNRAKIKSWTKKHG